MFVEVALSEDNRTSVCFQPDAYPCWNPVAAGLEEARQKLPNLEAELERRLAGWLRKAGCGSSRNEWPS